MCEVEARVGLNQRTIQRLVKAESFPQPVNLPGRTIAFVEAELEAWMRDRIEARNTERGSDE
ncbi:putative transcriptional regulator [Ruegeria phage DSS3-P1]|uniref:putative transcriptional regulator n=1 Tax=Ruegeria phage DSS3-P1 TaxID=1555208 RepID=UPI00051A9DDF|nr:putative transcriptional regulator [Ruegeria phage DSS3-P1]YP_009997200.1 putative transcriptional regulator [Ruegeria phage vB_RpoS-V16]YP_009997280.1 putative transcriptional regulator [Ruegeria phage vB_RpoS-V18]YP_009997362.1 putative transcriptional regulator [Ruegeria phage vB_RpoS-V11]YP_009997445.1 putative transcriptional regulator [Ruegeria phage vB_RpoS-V7]AIT13298.1 putative transcriptional regulator [Ruegeria phage DSS3-P1]AWY08767.1 putative transcriptional regulator [Ruegeri